MILKFDKQGVIKKTQFFGCYYCPIFLKNREKLFNLATKQFLSSKELKVFVHVLADNLAELAGVGRGGGRGRERGGKLEASCRARWER